MGIGKNVFLGCNETETFQGVFEGKSGYCGQSVTVPRQRSDDSTGRPDGSPLENSRDTLINLPEN